LGITAYHAKYYAHELTVRKSSTAVDRIATSLFDASVDLNPHQIEAALFALRSPLSKGVMLADEVGLGKTIEAGILLCQYWAEHRRRLLIICPAALRRQWSIEMEEKFNLPSIILEKDSYEALKTAQDTPPLYQDQIVIMSYHFANKHREELSELPWDLIAIDEAHKLRNLYKKDNKIGKNLKEALEGFKKVLLTATPLQNSLMELYGLASLIDDRLFGNLVSFKANYINSSPDLNELKTRLKPFSHRTLRKDVLEYIKYTKREAITQPFTPSEQEQLLYDEVSNFLLLEDTYTIPWAQRKLVVLIIRKLLASSSYAIIGTLQTIKTRLEAMKHTKQDSSDDMGHELIEENDLDHEYLEQGDENIPMHKGRPIDLEQLQYEIDEMDRFTEIARSIEVESKAVELVKALDVGFSRMKELGGARKALIFTESSRTQSYLRGYLEDNGYKGKIVTFNGQNNDDLCRQVYADWLEENKDTGRITGSKVVDMRMSLVDRFKNGAEIMIATEAAAEGINLQFCSLIVNYDLPWNPQRVEQRIGRCHRYGQKHDVVVINFLNETNSADQRIYQLLKEKFQLFDGVFGASDEILGSLESGVDFESRIYQIFETCRHPEEIDIAFNELQEELDEPIQEKLSEARQMLFEHFDGDVHARLKLQLEEAEKRMDEITQAFWSLTKFMNKDDYYFNEEKLIFGADKEFIAKGERPESHNNVPIYYYLDSDPELEAEYNATTNPPPVIKPKRGAGAPIQGYPHRISSLEGELMIKRAKTELNTDSAVVKFNLSDHPLKISLLEEQQGKSGWLFLNKLSITSFEDTESLIFTVCDADGNMLKPEVGEKLFALNAEVSNENYQEPSNTNELISHQQGQVEEVTRKTELNNNGYFDEELDKLDRWAEDLKVGLELELKQLDKDIREANRLSKQINSLEEKLEYQKKKASLEKKRTRKRHELFTAQDDIDKKRDKLIEQIEKQLRNSAHDVEELFKIQWEVV